MPALPGSLRRTAIFWNCSAYKTKNLHTILNLRRRTPTRDLHLAFEIPYIYDFVTKLCRQQATVIQNHENVKFRNIGQGGAQHRKRKNPKLGGGQAYDR
jgi:hypothetical protein